MKGIRDLVLVLFWMMGLVLAHGWLKLAALFPLYAWYVATEFLMKYFGVI